MKNLLLLLFLAMPSFLMAQEKIGKKIYKYGDVYHSIQGTTLISFEEAEAKLMSQTLEYFSKGGANVKSWNSIFLPGTEVSEDAFVGTLNENNIETLLLIDVIDASSATVNRTSSSAYSEINQKKGKVSAVSTAVETTKTVDYITELNLRLTIFSSKDGFSKPVCVVEGNITNESPDTTSDQLARRIIRRMIKALDEENAF